MLQKNPLCPPAPFQGSRAHEASAPWNAGVERFVSAEDFDAIGVLAGMDPCESRYWWIPELYAPEASSAGARSPLAELLARGGVQATSRPLSRPTAAA